MPKACFFLTSNPPLNVSSDRAMHFVLDVIALPPELIMIDMIIGDLEGPTNVSVSGVKEGVDYFLYRDDYDKKEILRSQNGTLRFYLDGSSKHVWIQDKPSSLVLRDDDVGGDCNSAGRGIIQRRRAY